jgi:hypothetical protein
MTLPPRLPTVPFPPEPGAAERIVSRARRRRRTRAGGALGVVASCAAGIALFVPHGDTAGLQPVAGGPPRVVNSAPRETVPNRPEVPCDEQDGLTVRPESNAMIMTCLRYSWPQTQPVGGPVTFAVEWCALDRDLTADMLTWPEVSVLSRDEGLQWALRLTTNLTFTRQTLRAQTCWRWRVTWNGVGDDYTTHTFTGFVGFPRGTYHVRVGWPLMKDGPHSQGTFASHRQTTLRLR